jgi:hypothetical protein
MCNRRTTKIDGLGGSALGGGGSSGPNTEFDSTGSPLSNLSPQKRGSTVDYDAKAMGQPGAVLAPPCGAIES